MPVHSVERKLAAIFAADIAGYSRLMARDEVAALARLKACRVIIDGLIASHRGRIFSTAGDSVVADFAVRPDDDLTYCNCLQTRWSVGRIRLCVERREDRYDRRQGCARYWATAKSALILDLRFG